MVREFPVLPLRPVLPLLCALVAACGHRPPELPAGGSIKHYRVPWADAFPSDVAVDDRGRLWFTDRLTHALGVFDPRTEEFRRFQTPTPKSAPYGLVRDPEGMLWFGESNGGRLGRLDPATGEILEVEIPEIRTGPRLLAWAGGAVWYTVQAEDAYGRYDPATGTHIVWRGRVEQPYGIAAVGDQVWVASQDGTTLYRVDGTPPEPGPLPSVDLSEPAPLRLSPAQRERLSAEQLARLRSRRRTAGIRRLAADERGRIWVTEYGRGRVTGVNPRGDDRVHIETLDQPSRPYGLTADARGRIWFSEQGNGTLVAYEVRTAERRVLALPVPGGTVRHIAVDAARGRVWLPLSDAGVIALVEF